ncbi:MAG: hypothetical protein ACKPAD_16435 [Bacteroidota bacterium]
MIQGTRDYLPVYDRKFDGYLDLKEVVEFISSDLSEAKAVTQGGTEINYFPSTKFKIPVDSATVVANGTVSKEMASRIVKNVEFDVDRSYLMKADIMILDLLAHNNWERPVYFAITVGSESYLNLEDYFQLEGMAYRLVPVKNPKRQDGQMGAVNASVMYDKLVNIFQWGNMSDPRVYLDQNNLNMTMNLRNNFGRLAEALLQEGKRDSAMNVLDKCIKEMPDNTVPYNIMMIRIAEMYYGVANYGSSPGRPAITAPNNPGVVLVPAAPATDPIPFPRSKEATEKADQIMNRLGEIYQNDFNYYVSLANSEFFSGVQDELGQSIAVFRELERIANNYGRSEIASGMRKKYEAAETRLLGK